MCRYVQDIFLCFHSPLSNLKAQACMFPLSHNVIQGRLAISDGNGFLLFGELCSSVQMGRLDQISIAAQQG